MKVSVGLEHNSIEAFPTINKTEIGHSDGSQKVLWTEMAKVELVSHGSEALK